MKLVMITALVLGAACGKDATTGAADDGSIDVARRAVKQIAFEAYPMWSATHPDKECPAVLTDMAEAKVALDPWASPFKLYCGPTAPKGVRGLGVASLGPDRKEGTADDIRSWDSP